jgi:hypothetical protein
MVRRLPLLVLLLALAGGCADDPGSTDANDPADSAAAADPDVVAAYRAWLDGLAAGDAEATCAVHAPDFTIELRQRAILAKRASQGDPCVDFVALLWEVENVETDAGTIEVTELTGEKATLAVEFPGTDQTVRMVNRYGNWYLAETVDRVTEGGAAWAAAWCSLSIHMDRAEIIGRMGEPSGEYTVSDGWDPHLWWAQGPYDFRVYLEPDGSVSELVAEYDALAASERAQLDCPSLRNQTNS